ncbi:hypothetical protein [Maribacter sp. 2210JD10-5]|uniref:hypothetical protein n=1 Tax=Maribacter sp. 2210JD10-5 TaxID=3386272 RepID=UPI0039BD7DA5
MKKCYYGQYVLLVFFALNTTRCKNSTHQKNNKGIEALSEEKTFQNQYNDLARLNIIGKVKRIDYTTTDSLGHIRKKWYETFNDKGNFIGKFYLDSAESIKRHYTFDYQDMLLKTFSYFEVDSLKKQETYTYDNHRRVTKIDKGSIDETGWFMMYEKRKYNNKGFEIERTQTRDWVFNGKKENKQQWREEYRYDSLGNKTNILKYNALDALISETRNVYNTHNKITSFETTNYAYDGDTSMSSAKISYDTRDNLLSVVFTGMLSGFEKYTYTYNDRNNWAERTKSGSNTILLNTSRVFTYYE